MKIWISILFFLAGCSTLQRESNETVGTTSPESLSDNQLKLPKGEYFLSILVEGPTDKKSRKYHFDYKKNMQDEFDVGLEPFRCFVETIKIDSKPDDSDYYFSQFKGNTFLVKCSNELVNTGMSIIVLCDASVLKANTLILHDWSKKKPSSAFIIAECRNNPDFR